MKYETHKTLEFLNEIRKEKSGLSKSIRDLLPAIIVGEYISDYVEEYCLVDQVKFLQAPVDIMDLKEKVSSFFDKKPIRQERILNIAEGETLIYEGAHDGEMYWVMEGEFRILKTNMNEENVIIGEVKAGELVGELSFLDDMPRSASVVATCDSEVLVIPQKKFVDVLESQPRWFKSLMQTMSHRLRSANKKIVTKL